MREGWPMFVVAAGMVLLAFVSILGLGLGGPPILYPQIWALASLVIAFLAVRVGLVPRCHSRRLQATTVLATFGAIRSFAYLTAGAWAPLGVWIIVAGLLAAAYRTARTNDALRARIDESAAAGS